MSKPTHTHSPKESSLVERIEWTSGEAPVMVVHLKGGKEYTYHGVPEAEYHAFVDAKSYGSHFGKHIKGKYRKPDDDES